MTSRRRQTNIMLGLSQPERGLESATGGRSAGRETIRGSTSRQSFGGMDLSDAPQPAQSRGRSACLCDSRQRRGAVVGPWFGPAEKRVLVVLPGRLVRGAWQDPGSLRAIIARERIKTIVTLTAINRDDPKYLAQAQVVADTGVGWVIVPMRGSRATLEQMARAADLLADPSLQPVFFHCVAGHHRTSLAHAAYLIRYRGCSADAAWAAVAGMPWTPARSRRR